MERDPAVVAQHLSAYVLTDRGGSWVQQIKDKLVKQQRTMKSADHQCSTLTIQMQQHVGLEQIFGPCHFAFCHTRAKRHPNGATRVTVDC